ncbi:MAG: hypothetical protein P4L67_02675 [Candidatus Pacebacteria bacterium]|nr:hypothetical protein [Candidatus Paceibacterota bacterium]
MTIAVRICLIATLCTAALVSPPRIHAQTTDLTEEVRPKEPIRKKPDKIDFVHWASRGYLAAGTWLDASTTANGLGHPTMAYRADNNTLLMHYTVTEVGWAGCLGRQNTFTAVSANVLLNVGVERFSNRLYLRGGRWRYVAIGLLAAKATDNLVAGINNERFQAGIDGRVRQLTGYRGVIVWSR